VQVSRDKFTLEGGVGVLSSYKYPPGLGIGALNLSPNGMPCTAYDCARQCYSQYYPANVDNQDGFCARRASYECAATCPGVSFPEWNSLTVMDGVWASSAQNCTMKYIPGEHTSTALTGGPTSTSVQSASATATQNDTLTAIGSGGSISTGASSASSAKATAAMGSTNAAIQSSSPSTPSRSKGSSGATLDNAFCIWVAAMSGWALSSRAF